MKPNLGGGVRVAVVIVLVIVACARSRDDTGHHVSTEADRGGESGSEVPRALYGGVLKVRSSRRVFFTPDGKYIVPAEYFLRGQHKLIGVTSGKDSTVGVTHGEDSTEIGWNVSTSNSVNYLYTKLCRKVHCLQNQTCVVNMHSLASVCTGKIRGVARRHPVGQNRTEFIGRQREAKYGVKSSKRTDQSGNNATVKTNDLSPEERSMAMKRDRSRESKLHSSTPLSPLADKNWSLSRRISDAPSVEDTPGCRGRDLEATGARLLDAFKARQDSDRKRKKEKRNSTKKELHEDDACICQAPVAWQFQHFDSIADGRLSRAELVTSNEETGASGSVDACVERFYSACDTDKDGLLTEKEWCCCFAAVLPPCLTAMKEVPHILLRGRPVLLPGAYIPQCDDDGFFSAVQCRSSTGECWCADRHGTQINGTVVTRGTPQCGEGFS